MYFDKPLEDFFRRENSPRVTVKCQQVIKDLDRQISTCRDHYQGGEGYFTTGMSVLATVIREACNPEQDYNVEDSDYKKYTSSLAPRINSLNTIFDPVLGRNKSKHWFVSNKTCHEIIFGVTANRPLSDYPMDGDWSNYRPFRMVFHDSSELSLYVNSGMLNFKRIYPYMAFYTFDVAAAALQWTYLSQKDSSLTIQEYVHKYLIMPAITEDNITIWMLGTYCQWFSSYQRDYQDIPYFTSQYVHIPQRMNSAENEVATLIDTARQGGIYPERLIGALPLPGGRSITDYYHEMRKYAVLPDMTQYYWGTLFKERQIIQLVMLSLSCNVKDPEVITLVRRFQMQAQYLENSNISRVPYDKFVRHKIEDFVRYMSDSFTKMRDLSQPS